MNFILNWLCYVNILLYNFICSFIQSRLLYNIVTVRIETQQYNKQDAVKLKFSDLAMGVNFSALAVKWARKDIGFRPDTASIFIRIKKQTFVAVFG